MGTAFAGWFGGMAWLVRSPIRRLPQPTIRIVAHLHPQRDQHLLDPHVPVPVSHGGELRRDDRPVLVDAAHVDLGDEPNVRRDGGVLVSAVKAELVPPVGKVGLSKSQNTTVSLQSSLHAFSCGCV
jgi:hypothetical protein